MRQKEQMKAFIETRETVWYIFYYIGILSFTNNANFFFFCFVVVRILIIQAETFFRINWQWNKYLKFLVNRLSSSRQAGLLS